jgi:hypothetical protein
VRALTGEIDEFDEIYGYKGLLSATRAWLALRDGDLDATEAHGAAALADWPADKRAGPTVFQWTARFPLLAAAVERRRLDAVAEQTHAMLDESQQPLSRTCEQRSRRATFRPSSSSHADTATPRPSASSSPARCCG